ncbi:MAG TPA: AAA family ATPase [Chthoniobacterales bacterium]|nr:AAA family ATPase [Chthoniobacterales bacterium]
MASVTSQRELLLNQPVSPSIVGVEVRNLFGYLSYDIGARRSTKAADILLLYGDNGSGKTSILRLLFYLLSPVNGRGHKTAVARIAFSRFSVFFDTGIEVSAVRPEGQSNGSFQMTISVGSRVLHQFSFEADSEGSVRVASVKQEEELIAFFEALAGLGIALFFLKDDRSIESTLFDDKRDDDETVLREMKVVRRATSTSTLKAVRVAVNRAAMWVRTQAFRASNRGDTNTYNVYLEIIRRITTTPPKGKGRKRGKGTGNLVKKLREVARRSEELSSLGLIPRVDVAEMSALLRRIKSDRAAIVEQIVLPYIDAMTARFDALKPVATALEKFLFYLNRFYQNKRVVFDLQSGFRIQSPLEQVLTPGMLSSGERHLLLLFCNVLIAEEHPSLFIIDEPELSLNVRWQRLLINALVDCVRGTQVRFVFATHSVEMLAQHRKSVQKLEPIGKRASKLARLHDGRQATT